MPNRAEIEFGDGKYGWTESYYDNNDENSQELTETAARKLADSRAELLAGPSGTTPPTQPVIERIVITTIGNPRLSRVVKFNNTSSKTIKNRSQPAGSAPDNPYSAYGVTFQLQNGHKSPRAISGVPDAALTGQTGVKGLTGFFGALDRFIAHLTADNSPWGALTFAPSPQPLNMITAITQDPNGRPTITPAEALVAPDGSCSLEVVIADYSPEPRTPSINGQHSAIIVGENVMLKTVYKPLKPLCKGYIWLYEPAWSKFVGGTKTGPRKKNRGRPLNLPVGKSKPKP